MRALDLFCGAGGASAGLASAGFDVTGVDSHPQPRYPFRFVQADALSFDLAGFDFIWASPPCQRFSMFTKNLAKAEKFPDLIEPTRARLLEMGAPYVIENVPGAPLRPTLMLCGSMFGLAVRRHRFFETSFAITRPPPACKHEGLAIPVYGRSTPKWYFERVGRIDETTRQRAMGINWMGVRELSQAIPPVYSKFIAEQLS